MSFLAARSIGTEIDLNARVIPHQLCSCCTAFVQHAHHLRKPKEELESIYKEWKDKPHPRNPSRLTVETNSTYPSLQYIMESAKRGCHMCATLSITIEEDPTLNSVIEDKTRPVYTSFVHIATFSVRLYLHRPSDIESAQSYCLIHRKDNDFTIGCEDCANCMIDDNPASYGQSAPGRDSLIGVRNPSPSDYAHCRWTSHTAAGLNFRLIRTWLDNCLAKHRKCETYSDLERPTRLLHIQSSVEETIIRIIPGKQDCASRYATLSYRWGECKDFVLTRQSIAAFEHGIPLSSLPKTFYDAVYVCQQLDIEYLWVDALCIIQGPDGDWKDEIPRMEAVYAGSTLTIAVAEALNSEEGFLGFRCPLRYQPCKLYSDECHTLLVTNNGYASCRRSANRPGSTPLDGRGWVLQETALSPRTVYFKKEDIHWDCRQAVLCETYRCKHGYHPVDTRLKSIYSSMREAARDIPPGTGIAPGVFSTWRDWNFLISKYAVTKLSQQEDKLAALAGIARVLQMRPDMQASFGLWLRLFMFELVWYTRPTPSHRELSLAPTWSWAGLTGAEACSNAVKEMVDDQDNIVLIAKIIELPQPTGFGRLITRSYTDMATNYSVTIEGPIHHCTVEPADYPPHRLVLEEDLNREQGCKSIFPNRREEAKSAEIYYTHDVPVKDYEVTVYCLVLLHCTRSQALRTGQIVEFGLVLKPVPHDDSRYYRAGFYYVIFNKDVYPFQLDVPAAVVKIV